MESAWVASWTGRNQSGGHKVDKFHRCWLLTGDYVILGIKMTSLFSSSAAAFNLRCTASSNKSNLIPQPFWNIQLDLYGLKSFNMKMGMKMIPWPRWRSSQTGQRRIKTIKTHAPSRIRHHCWRELSGESWLTEQQEEEVSAESLSASCVILQGVCWSRSSTGDHLPPQWHWA